MFLRAWRHPVTRGNRFGAMARYLSWKVSACMSPGPAVIPFVNDTFLLGEPDTHEARQLRLLTLIDFEAMAFVAHFLRPDEYLVDVGASIGSYAVLAAAASGAYVTAFEPAPARAALLRRNVALNELEGFIDPRECAIGENVGQRECAVEADCGITVPERRPPGQCISVNVTRLDEARLGGRPVLAKIDVAGGELAVLRGAHATLGWASLCAVIVGSDPRRPAGVAKPHLVQTVMERHGFIPVDYDPLRRCVTHVGIGLRRKTIYVRARQAEHVSRRLARASGLWVTEELCI